MRLESTAATLAVLLGLAACQGSPTLAPAPVVDSVPAAQPPSEPLKLYVFDCGSIALTDVAAFGLTNDETPVRELFVPCYLVVHPEGTLLWDAGLPLTYAGKADVVFQPGTKVSYRRSLMAQLNDIGMDANAIEYIALSHMHFDHAGAANEFPNAHLLIQRPEYEAAFEQPEAYPVFDVTLYDALADNPRTLLDGAHDVFGDDRVLIVSAPGHTPGHQVLYIDLANTGPVVLSGDLYHFRESRALRRTPVFNTDREATLRSMDKIDAFLEDKQATLWIEHDMALARTLRKAPLYHD